MDGLRAVHVNDELHVSQVDVAGRRGQIASGADAASFQEARTCQATVPVGPHVRRSPASSCWPSFARVVRTRGDL